MNENAARQPKGIPTGGRFAPDLRAEPDVSLAAAPEFRDGVRVVAGRKSGTVSGSPNPDGTVYVNLDGGGCIVVSPELLEPEPPAHRLRHPEWTEIAKELAAQSGASEREARATVALGTAVALGRSYAESAQAMRDKGNTTGAAFAAVTLGALKGLPGKLHAAADSTETMAGAVDEARERLRRDRALLDGYSPAGSQPAFAAADEILSDLHDFILEDAG